MIMEIPSGNYWESSDLKGRGNNIKQMSREPRY